MKFIFSKFVKNYDWISYKSTIKIVIKVLYSTMQIGLALIFQNKKKSGIWNNNNNNEPKK